MALAGAATNAVTEIVIKSALWNIFITSPIGFLLYLFKNCGGHSIGMVSKTLMQDQS